MIMRWGWDPMWSFSKIWVQILYFIHWRYLICWTSSALEVPHKICWVRQNLGCDLKVGQCRPNAKLATPTNELWLTYVRTILKVIKWDLVLDDCPINMCFSWFFKKLSLQRKCHALATSRLVWHMLLAIFVWFLWWVFYLASSLELSQI